MTFQICDKKRTLHSLQRHATLNDFFWSTEKLLSVDNLGLIYPWLDWTGSFADWICICKVFKYIRNIESLILDRRLDFKVEGFV